MVAQRERWFGRKPSPARDAPMNASESPGFRSLVGSGRLDSGGIFRVPAFWSGAASLGRNAAVLLAFLTRIGGSLG
jgi:hypothetical protein